MGKAVSANKKLDPTYPNQFPNLSLDEWLDVALVQSLRKDQARTKRSFKERLEK